MLNTVTYRSTNGRWGVQVLLPEGMKDLRSPVKGTIRSLGTAGGLTCFQLILASEGESSEAYVLLGEDLSPVEGCVEVYHEDLQSGRCCTILLLQPGAIWRSYSYKRRGCTIHMLTQDGQVITPPPAVLLAAGLMQPATGSVTDVPPLPPLPDHLSAAMREAGLITR